MTFGLAIGLAGGWMLSRFVQAFLFKLDAHDPIVYLSVAARARGRPASWPRSFPLAARRGSIR